ncbi:hypothetical protein [Candidatus Poriferisodalis sp.]|uniref:hypothetical protein n=1 Tax=Candidatus Poriferisodalis sp. TaxID=3101277 RepID=UPI003B01EE24
MALVLDSGGVSFLAGRSRGAGVLRLTLVSEGVWPPLVPSPVLVECLRDPGRDANTNCLLKSCGIVTDIDEGVARRAAWLRTRARRGSAIDALVVACAEPGGSVLTGDRGDISALAAHARDVRVEQI